MDTGKWLSKSILCWLDYESTGVDFEDGSMLPIEIGLRLTDTRLGQLCPGYGKYIRWDALLGSRSWAEFSESADIAAGIHHIPFRVVREFGTHPTVVAREVRELVEKHTPEDGRCILISDNIQFEWKLTEMLMKQLPDNPWPFHYCGWDTSVLQLVPGLGFEDPPDPPHSALGDITELLDAVQRAFVRQARTINKAGAA